MLISSLEKQVQQEEIAKASQTKQNTDHNMDKKKHFKIKLPKSRSLY